MLLYSRLWDLQYQAQLKGSIQVYRNVISHSSGEMNRLQEELLTDWDVSDWEQCGEQSIAAAAVLVVGAWWQSLPVTSLLPFRGHPTAQQIWVMWSKLLGVKTPGTVIECINRWWNTTHISPIGKHWVANGTPWFFMEEIWGQTGLESCGSDGSHFNCPYTWM